MSYPYISTVDKYLNRERMVHVNSQLIKIPTLIEPKKKYEYLPTDANIMFWV
jgi:hypothetical protein